MPKLRNSSTDVGMFTQWLGRKCRNHHPLKELEKSKSERAGLPNIYKTQASKSVEILGESCLIYESAGRIFKVEVAELEREELMDLQNECERVKVGY